MTLEAKKIESYLEVFRVKFCHTPRGWSPPADEAVIRKFWRPKGLRVKKRSRKINNKHFEGSNAALGRDSKRVTFSFVLVIYTLCLSAFVIA